MNERNLNEGQWEDRKQWSLGVRQRRKAFWNRYIYIYINNRLTSLIGGVCFVRPLLYPVKLSVPTKQATTSLSKAKSCNALLHMLVVGIHSYLKSVLRYKFLILNTYYIDNLHLPEKRFVVILEAKRGPRAQEFGKLCFGINLWNIMESAENGSTLTIRYSPRFSSVSSVSRTKSKAISSPYHKILCEFLL
jgi:hypothetical protein